MSLFLIRTPSFRLSIRQRHLNRRVTIVFAKSRRVTIIFTHLRTTSKLVAFRESDIESTLVDRSRIDPEVERQEGAKRSEKKWKQVGCPSWWTRGSNRSDRAPHLRLSHTAEPANPFERSIGDSSESNAEQRCAAGGSKTEKKRM